MLKVTTIFLRQAVTHCGRFFLVLPVQLRRLLRWRVYSACFNYFLNPSASLGTTFPKLSSSQPIQCIYPYIPYYSPFAYFAITFTNSHSFSLFLVCIFVDRCVKRLPYPVKQPAVGKGGLTEIFPTFSFSACYRYPGILLAGSLIFETQKFVGMLISLVVLWLYGYRLIKNNGSLFARLYTRFGYHKWLKTGHMWVTFLIGI